MPTYAENAARQERDAKRSAQDRRDAARHKGFDLSAQDTHHKYERYRFSVVGEGTRSATENFLTNYERIAWS